MCSRHELLCPICMDKVHNLGFLCLDILLMVCINHHVYHDITLFHDDKRCDVAVRRTIKFLEKKRFLISTDTHCEIDKCTDDDDRNNLLAVDINLTTGVYDLDNRFFCWCYRKKINT